MKPKDFLNSLSILSQVDLKKPGIYLIYCKDNEMVYVGQTKGKGGFKSRWAHHLYRLRKPDLRYKTGTGNPYMKNVYNKYGEASFQFVAIENCLPENLNEREGYYINLFDPDFVMNIAPVQSSFEATDEYREAQSERMKKYYQDHPEKANRGINIEARKYWNSDEGKARKLKQSAENTGKKYGPMSEEQKEKLRQIRTGTKLSEEHKKKISESGKGRKHSPESIQLMREKAYQNWQKRKEKIQEAA